MEKKGKLLGFYNYTVVLTYIGMLTGFFGISCAFLGKSYQAVVCLIIAGFCDMFDGAIASTKKDRTVDEKSFGVQIDSLSDFLCFGVLPAVITFTLAPKNYFGHAAAGFYVLCALIRLAYFNVEEINRQQTSGGSREYYYGMPVTMSAMIVPFFYALGVFFDLTQNIPGIVALFASGICFLVPVRTRKPGVRGKIWFLAVALVEVVMMILICKLH